MIKLFIIRLFLILCSFYNQQFIREQREGYDILKPKEFSTEKYPLANSQETDQYIISKENYGYKVLLPSNRTSPSDILKVNDKSCRIEEIKPEKISPSIYQSMSQSDKEKLCNHRVFVKLYINDKGQVAEMEFLLKDNPENLLPIFSKLEKNIKAFHYSLPLCIVQKGKYFSFHQSLPKLDN